MDRSVVEHHEPPPRAAAAAAAAIDKRITGQGLRTLAVLAAVQRRVQQLRNLPDLGRHREGRVGGDGVVSVGRGARGRPSVVR
jgi:hypothetical protein